MADCRAAGYCARGVVARFVQLGYSKHQIIREGIPIEELAKVDDAQIHRAIEQAEKRLRGPHG